MNFLSADLSHVEPGATLGLLQAEVPTLAATKRTTL
jgi:hypothetical protein